MKFKKLSVCLDMYGCPNKCKHCWLGVTPNRNMCIEDLYFVAKEFRQFSNDYEIFDRYREEDFPDNYKELWDITTELSDNKTPHFENISYWRAVRDAAYVPWLYSLGVRAAQLTLFGNEKTTDYFIGRKGAYQEIIKTINILIDNSIAPRIQVFVYKTNISQLFNVLNLIESMDLKRKCSDFDKEFSFFLHQGSCGGENEQFYNEWITIDDVDKIPPKLLEYSLKHWDKSNIMEVLGDTESNLYNKLIINKSVMDSIVTETPVFFVDNEFNVYPNYETPSKLWLLGNIKKDGVETILKRYINNETTAQHIMTSVPISDMVEKHGNSNSIRLFGEWDYKNYLLVKYCHTL